MNLTALGRHAGRRLRAVALLTLTLAGVSLPTSQAAPPPAPLPAAATAGTLDPSFGGFGTGGQRIYDYGSSVEGHAAVIDGSGRVVVAGDSLWESGGVLNNQFMVARFLPDGTPDSTFSGDGFAHSNFGNGADSARSVASLPDGRIVVAGYAYLNGQYDLALGRFLSNGTLDTTFSGDGKVTTDIAGGDDQAKAVALQDGQIVVAGYSEDPQTQEDRALLARYTATGVPDSTFGVGAGWRRLNLAADGQFNAVAIDRVDDSIVTAGQVGADYLLVRFAADGTSYTMHYPAFGSVEAFTALAMFPGGDIFAGGMACSGSCDFSAARYNEVGEAELTFGTNGYARTNLGGTEFASGALLQSGDRLVLAGGSSQAGAVDTALVRYTPLGELDRVFGSGGVSVAAFPGNDRAAALVQLRDGRLLAVGTRTGTPNALALTRYFPDGTLDAGGRQLVDFGESDNAHAAAFLPDGRLVVAGSTSTDSLDTTDFTLARFTAAGQLDPGFGSDGRATHHTGDSDTIRALIALADGRVLAAGSGGSHGTSDFALLRFLEDGTLDDSFGSSGLVLTDFGGSDAASSMAQQPDGKIVLAGAAVLNSGTYFAIARYTANGTPDTTFDGDGKALVSFGSLARAEAVAVQPDGKIVLAGYVLDGANYDFALARLHPNGGLDTSFDSDGRLVFGFGNNDYARGLVLQPDGAIVAAGSSGAGSASDIAVARFGPDGSPDTGFDGDGRLLLNLGGADEAWAAALQGARLLMAGCVTRPDGSRQFHLAALTLTGTLDSGFGTGGQVSTRFTGSDCARALALAPNRIAAVGRASDSGMGTMAIAVYQAGNAPGFPSLFLPLITR